MKIRCAMLLIGIIAGGCNKNTPAQQAKEYVEGWSRMGMYLPEKGEIEFFCSNRSGTDDVLLGALSHSNPKVRMRAAHVIRGMGGEAWDLGTHVASQLNVEDDRLVRMYLYDALRGTAYSTDDVTGELRKRFDSLDGRNIPPAAGHGYAPADERISVAKALYVLDDSQRRSEYLSYIMSWLRPPEEGMEEDMLAGYRKRRWCAVIALEHMHGANEAIVPLEKMLDEPDAKMWVSSHVPRVLKALRQNKHSSERQSEAHTQE